MRQSNDMCLRCGWDYHTGPECYCERIDRESRDTAAKMTSGYLKTYPLPVELPPELPLPGERWKHYKGGTYEIVMIARHTETQEAIVVYRNLKYGTAWARPLNVWQERTSTGARRFVRI